MVLAKTISFSIAPVPASPTLSPGWLTGLHDDHDEKIFQSVIIVTDRRVLDSQQLQDTVYQFDHVAGVVQKIDKNARQLREAIEAGTGIITPLQKFPFIYKEESTGNKRFAVIVDEAQSSPTWLPPAMSRMRTSV